MLEIARAESDAEHYDYMMATRSAGLAIDHLGEHAVDAALAAAAGERRREGLVLRPGSHVNDSGGGPS
jgi:hypothetical protein